MIHVLLPQASSYRDITEYLRERGARVTIVGSGAQGMSGKLAIVLSMFSPNLLRCFGLWTRADRLLVVGWQALPVLALIKARLLPRPQRLLVMSCFVHGKRARRLADRVLRALRIPGLGFIAFSPGEARNLVQNVGMPPQDVHCHLWRQELDGRASQQVDDGSIFAGGFSNRDYDLLLEAAEPLPAPLVIVASQRNQIRQPARGSTRILRDLPEAEFENLLARSSVVAMPLRGVGEACGQSVLLRVLRHGKPLVATRHEAIEAYLGEDYPGFVPHDDVQAMRHALARALEQPAQREELAQRVRLAAGRLEGRGEPGAEIEQFLLGRSMARPVRILQLVPEPLPTFRADVATLFGKYLPRHGVQCHLVGKGSAAPADNQGFASSRRARAGARWKAELSFLWLCLRALFGANRRSHDAVQVRDMVSIGLLALLVARMKGLPMMYWLSYLMSEGRIERAQDELARLPGPGGLRRLRARLVLAKGLAERWLLYRVLLPRADHVFVQSEAMASLVARQGVPAGRISAVPMGVDMEALARPEVRPAARPWQGWERRPVVAYLGTLDRARCLERVLDALVLVRRELPDASLLLIGSSPQQGDVALLLGAARERGLADAVQVTGWLPPAQAWEFLLGAQAAISYVPRGALYDVSSPTKLLEYLALGMPCVGNDIPDQEAVLAASGAGWLAASTPQAMAEGLLDILRDPKAARERAAAGPAYIEAARSYRVLGEAVAQRYQNLVGGDHAGRIA